MSDSTGLVKLAVERGMLAPDQADAARVPAPEELVRRGLLDRRELDTLLRLAGTPRVMFERYELVEEIGRGGMGIVFKCRDRKLDRLVALKTFKSHFGDELDRFAREAQTAARLKHPNPSTRPEPVEGLARGRRRPGVCRERRAEGADVLDVFG